MEASSTMSRRDQVAVAVFGTWMVTGLFVDGWAHNAEKPEDFWTPWHALLYSGFAAAMAWGVWDGRRSGRAPIDSVGGRDRLLGIGVVLFVLGAVGDMVWHEIFGVEEDIEALLSPTHLLLMGGGLLMASAPARAAIAERRFAPSLRTFAPALVSLTLATALVAFFWQFASAFSPEHELFAPGASEEAQALGVASILLATLFLVGPLVFVLRHWVAPRGTFTVLFGGVALFMAGLEAFDDLGLVVAFLAGGWLADLLSARLGPSAERRREAWVVAAAVPAVTWSVWFAAYAATRDLGWTVELWSGAILFAALTGLALAVLAFPPRPVQGTRHTQNSFPSGSAMTHQR